MPKQSSTTWPSTLKTSWLTSSATLHHVSLSVCLSPNLSDAVGRLRDMLDSLEVASPPRGSWRIADLGCGSGLMGRTLSGYSSLSPGEESKEAMVITLGEGEVFPTICEGGIFVGVDVSPNMLIEAKRNGGYDWLLCGDLLQALREGESLLQRLDLVVAADTL